MLERWRAHRRARDEADRRRRRAQQERENEERQRQLDEQAAYWKAEKAERDRATPEERWSEDIAHARMMGEWHSLDPRP